MARMMAGKVGAESPANANWKVGGGFSAKEPWTDIDSTCELASDLRVDEDRLWLWTK
jgi:hypothetical protein